MEAHPSQLIGRLSGEVEKPKVRDLRSNCMVLPWKANLTLRVPGWLSQRRIQVLISGLQVRAPCWKYRLFKNKIFFFKSSPSSHTSLQISVASVPLRGCWFPSTSEAPPISPSVSKHQTEGWNCLGTHINVSAFYRTSVGRWEAREFEANRFWL